MPFQGLQMALGPLIGKCAFPVVSAPESEPHDEQHNNGNLSESCDAENPYDLSSSDTFLVNLTRFASAVDSVPDANSMLVVL